MGLTSALNTRKSTIQYKWHVLLLLFTKLKRKGELYENTPVQGTETLKDFKTAGGRA